MAIEGSDFCIDHCEKNSAYYTSKNIESIEIIENTQKDEENQIDIDNIKNDEIINKFDNKEDKIDDVFLNENLSDEEIP